MPRRGRPWTTTLEALAPETRRHAGRCVLQLLHLRFNLANILRDLGRFERGPGPGRGGAAQQTQLLGASHPHTLMTAGGFAGDLRALGRYAEALERDLRHLRRVAWRCSATTTRAP